VPTPPVAHPTNTAATIATAVGDAAAVRLGPPPAIVTCTVKHTVFYPDGISISQKAQVAAASGWGGIVIWAASYESDDVYDALQGVV
jgi:hypothetical protein